MPEPIDFLIIQDMQSALRAISTTADPPFHHTVESLSVKLDPDHNVEDIISSMVSADPQSPLRPFIILELPPDGPWEYQPADQILTELPFSIHFVNDTDVTQDDALLQEYLRAAADIEQAIAADHTRGALATDTRILSREMHELSGQMVWTTVSGVVRIYREYGRPNG